MLSWKVVPANPIPTKMIEYSRIEPMTIFLLPDLLINHPEIGNEIKAPTGRVNNTMPNSVSDKFNFWRILGIREAQLEKHRPTKKNKEPTAALFINLGLIFFKVVKIIFICLRIDYLFFKLFVT